MRVLLDECLPRRLTRELVGHDVTTVPEAGWSGKKNGELLGLASGLYDAFITIDSIPVYQQRVVGLSFGIIVLVLRASGSQGRCGSQRHAAAYAARCAD